MKRFLSFWLLLVSLLLNSNSAAEEFRIGYSILKEPGRSDMKALLERHIKQFHNRDSRYSDTIVLQECPQCKQPKPLAVIGESTSDNANIDCGDYGKEQIIYISPGASDPQFTRGREYVFSMNLSDDEQVKSIAYFLKYINKCSSIAVVYEEKPFSKRLKNAFPQQLFASCQIKSLNDSNNLAEFTRAILKPLWDNKAPLDAIVLFLNSEEGAGLSKEILQQGYKKVIMGPESFFKHSFIQNLGEEKSRVYVATPFVYEFGTREAWRFRNDYHKTSGKDPSLWSLFACEAVDLVINGALDLRSRNQEIESTRIKEFFERSNSIGTTLRGLSGPVFFDQNRVRRQVIMACIDHDRFTPLGGQIQCHIVNSNTDQGAVARMVATGRATKVPDTDSEYVTKLPVVYATIVLNGLRNFDWDRKSVEVDYEACVEWQSDVYGPDPKDIGFIKPDKPDEHVLNETEDDEKVSSPLKRGTDSKRLYKRKSRVYLDLDLSAFPFDYHKVQMLVGFRGSQDNNAILAAGELSNQNMLVPEVDNHFEILARPENSGCNYVEATKQNLIDPWTGEQYFKSRSIYELNLVLKRKFWYGMLSLIPLTIAIVSWGVIPLAAPHGFAKIGSAAIVPVLAAIYVYWVIPYKIQFFSFVNGFFAVNFLVVFTAVLYATLMEPRQISEGSSKLELSTTRPDGDHGVGKEEEAIAIRRTIDRISDGLARTHKIVFWLPRFALILVGTYCLAVILAAIWQGSKVSEIFTQ